MIVHGALVPPGALLEELLDRALPITCAPIEPEKRGLLRRQRRPATVPATDPVLDPTSTDTMRLTVAGFGNLTTSDVLRLTEALAAAAGEWDPPRVFFDSVVFVPEERLFRATLGGDVEGLVGVARAVGTSVERLGFFVDRRRFRPAIDLGTAAPAASSSDIARVVEAYGGFRGQEWAVDRLILMTQTFDGPRSTWRPLELVPVGHAR